MHTYIHTYIYIYVCVCVYMYLYTYSVYVLRIGNNVKKSLVVIPFFMPLGGGVGLMFD